MLQPAEWIKVIYASLHPEFIPGENLSSFYFAEAFKVQTSGTFFETIKMNLYEGQLSSLTWAWENGRIFQTASLFMLGMLAGRERLFIYSDSTMRLWLKTLAFALIWAGLTAFRWKLACDERRLDMLAEERLLRQDRR